MLRGAPTPPALPRFPPGSPDLPAQGSSRTGLRGGGCHGGIAEAPQPLKLLPPGEMGLGESRAPPSSPGGSDAAPHASRRAADWSPPNADTHFFVEDGLHVYLSGANGPFAEPAPSSSAPRTHPSAHPAPPRRGQPLPACLAQTNHPRGGQSRGTKRGGGNAGAVNAGARDLCSRVLPPLVI